MRFHIFLDIGPFFRTKKGFMRFDRRDRVTSWIKWRDRVDSHCRNSTWNCFQLCHKHATPLRFNSLRLALPWLHFYFAYFATLLLFRFDSHLRFAFPLRFPSLLRFFALFCGLTLNLTTNCNFYLLHHCVVAYGCQVSPQHSNEKQSEPL